MTPTRIFIFVLLAAILAGLVLYAGQGPQQTVAPSPESADDAELSDVPFTPTPVVPTNNNGLVVFGIGTLNGTLVKEKTTCPLDMGAISVGSVDKTRLELLSLEMAGDLKGLVEVRVMAKQGYRLTVLGSLTACDIAHKGVLQGEVRMLVKEIETGREEYLYVPASLEIH